MEDLRKSHPIDDSFMESFKRGVLLSLGTIVERFNTQMSNHPYKTQVRLSWGYDIEQGRKDLRVGTYVHGEANLPLIRIKALCLEFNESYNAWADKFKCEGSFYFVETEDKKWFREMAVSSIIMPIYNSDELKDFHAKTMILEAKKGHMPLSGRDTE